MSEWVHIETACKRYLKTVADARIKRDRLMRDREEMRETMDGLKAVRYDRDGGHAARLHGDDAVAEILSRLEAIDERIIEAAKECTEVMSEWLEVSDRMSGKSADMLSRHYIQGQTWEDIALLYAYSERHIYNLRTEAMFDLYDALPHGWR